MRRVDYCFTMLTKHLPSADNFDDHEVRVDCEVYFKTVRGPEGLLFEYQAFTVNEIMNMEVPGGVDVTNAIETKAGLLLNHDIKLHIEMNMDYLVSKFQDEEFFSLI